MMKFQNVLMLSLAVAFWGASFALLKLGLEELSPISLAVLRFIIALPLLTVISYLRQKSRFQTVLKAGWKTFSVLGLLGVTLYHISQNYGLQLTTASNSSLIISANPILIALLDHVIYKEPITWKQVLGIAIAFCGVILVIRPLEWAINPLGVVGDLLSMGSALSWACYSVLSKKAVLEHGAEHVTLSTILWGTLWLIPAALTLETIIIPQSLWLWFLLLMLGLFCSGVAYLFWGKALEEVSPTQAGVFLFFLPVVSVLFAHFILSEDIDSLLILGASLITLGVILTERG